MSKNKNIFNGNIDTNIIGDNNRIEKNVTNISNNNININNNINNGNNSSSNDAGVAIFGFGIAVVLIAVISFIYAIYFPIIF